MVNGKCRSLNAEPVEDKSILGNIYIGKVKNVVKNIGAAFIDLGDGKTGYYSLSENKNPLFSSSVFQNLSEEEQESRSLKIGDEVIVQVERDAVKTKAPVLSCRLNFTGKYIVLTLGKTQIGFSGKIKDAEWKDEIRTYLTGLKDSSFGIIVRTNAREASKEEIERELLLLRSKMESVLIKGKNRTCYSVLYEEEPAYVLSLRDTYARGLEQIVTDDKTCYEQMKNFLEQNQKEDLTKLCFYEDPLLSLIKLYSLETIIDEAIGRRVWLKSGGYLIIEPTEALTVIDVNTGKYAGKKNIDDTILKINLEAAEESARQLQLRNLSGIIIIDFIDMTLPEHKELLLNSLESALLKDPVKTVLVEMTKLGLVEITRKKVHKPLHELLT